MLLQPSLIILFVQDVALLQQFYTGLLGLKTAEAIPGEWVLLRPAHSGAGGFGIGLHKAGAGYTAAGAQPVQYHPNTKMVFDTAEDLFSLRQQLLHKGVQLEEVTTWEGYNWWVCNGQDPEGNVFQLRQRRGS